MALSFVDREATARLLCAYSLDGGLAFWPVSRVAARLTGFCVSASSAPSSRRDHDAAVQASARGRVLVVLEHARALRRDRHLGCRLSTAPSPRSTRYRCRGYPAQRSPGSPGAFLRP